MSTASERRPGKWMWVFAGCYVVLLGAVAGSLFYARGRALAELNSPKTLGQWQAWRDDVEHQAEHPGPVQRRVPKSVEPPALVLMRDYFAISLGGAVLFSSLLYWIMAWFLAGAFSFKTAVNSDNRNVLPRQ